MRMVVCLCTEALVTWPHMHGIACRSPGSRVTGSPPTVSEELLLFYKTSIMPTNPFVLQQLPMINFCRQSCLDSVCLLFFPTWAQKVFSEKSVRRNGSEFPRRSCWKRLGREMCGPPFWGCQSPNAHDFEYVWIFFPTLSSTLSPFFYFVWG